MLNDGLTVSLVGMGVVFAVLALLALSIKGISLFDRQSTSAPPAEVPTAPSPQSSDAAGEAIVPAVPTAARERRAEERGRRQGQSGP